MKVPFEVGERTFFLEQYTTHQEKEILLVDSFDITDIGSIFNILNFDVPDNLPLEVQKIILYKFREISLGDEVNITFTCNECKQGNEGIIEANNFIIPPQLNDSDIKKIFQTVTEDNLSEYIDAEIDLDEMDIKEYEELRQRIINNQFKIDFNKRTKCLKCGTLRNFNLSSLKYIIEIMSDETLMTMYKSYNHLIFFGHYSKEDIDSMYPFERDILSGLLNKTLDDLANK